MNTHRFHKPFRMIPFSLLCLGFLAVSTISPALAQPMKLDGLEEFYRRVLTLPGARLAETMGTYSRAGERLAVFSAFYVFEESQMDGSHWLRVGPTPDRPTGWVLKEFTEEWRSMMVMQFAPGGVRGPTIFFKSKASLQDILESPAPSREAGLLLDSLEAGIPDTRILATELDKGQTGSISFESQPYLLPILDFDTDSVRLDNGNPARLLEVASINAQGRPNVDTHGNLEREAIQNTKFNIVFVIDTTISMQPYIDRVKMMATDVARQMASFRQNNRASFGLVGFRNNMSEEPQKSGLEYVSRIFLPLAPGSDISALTAQLETMREAKVSTHSFSEDAVAGLYDGLQQMQWEDDAYRLLFFVTDAGALPPTDSKVRHRDVSLQSLASYASEHDIAVFPIHLQTPAAVRAGNVWEAEEQYRKIAFTGDANSSKYRAITGQSVEEFRQQISDISDALPQVITRSILPGTRIEKPAIKQAEDASLKDLIINEVFRQQQSIIGAVAGHQAPLFLRGWTTDMDLTNPLRDTLLVCVFLTRNQLNDLALRLQRIVDAAKSAGQTPEQFFKTLQSLAASASTDPERFGSRFATIADLGLLPRMDALLPYKTQILDLNDRTWLSMSFSEQQALIDELSAKVRLYRDLESSKKWKSFDNDPNNRGEDLYPLPLINLP